MTLDAILLTSVRGSNGTLQLGLLLEVPESDAEADEGQPGWEVLGPTDCVKARAKDFFRRHVMVKSPVDADLGGVLGAAAASLGPLKGINMSVDIDAYDMM